MVRISEQGVIQLGFPGTERLVRVQKRRFPQPRNVTARDPSPFELFGREFNLHFRGEINGWLGRRTFSPSEVLGGNEVRVVGFYFQPQNDGRWISQSEVAAKMGWQETNIGAVRFIARHALLRVWRRDRFGEQAIERLGIPWFLYSALRRNGISVLEEITDLSGDGIRKICGKKHVFQLLKAALSDCGVEWNPEVDFPQFSPKRRNF